ncbi:hypothetical protein [Dictyobacter formicarum]|uniref:Band 7 domain-containing protein n=1 Tax=Dictyobacter formicarum TaxID=2778368 RepID=A0ABQ3V817_9CHLR|nr:hypothetical protein [Dictyobacter formicarum]GHO82094.1 hypothetical protein KSZ_01000 [Dictyobacter formicarum]
MSTRPSPYRERALKYYSQQQQQETVLPRLISLRTAAVLWGALAVLLVAVVVSWFGQIPLFATTSGIVLGQKTAREAAGMYIFIPASQLNVVQVGMPVRVHVGINGPDFTTTVESVTQKVLAPADIRQQFNPGSNGWSVVQEPSIVARIKMVPALSLKAFAGSVISAQIQVGTRPVLALIPGIGQFVRGTK